MRGGRAGAGVLPIPFLIMTDHQLIPLGSSMVKWHSWMSLGMLARSLGRPMVGRSKVKGTKGEEMKWTWTWTWHTLVYRLSPLHLYSDYSRTLLGLWGRSSSSLEHLRPIRQFYHCNGLGIVIVMLCSEDPRWPDIPPRPGIRETPMPTLNPSWVLKLRSRLTGQCSPLWNSPSFIPKTSRHRVFKLGYWPSLLTFTLGNWRSG